MSFRYFSVLLFIVFLSCFTMYLLIDVGMLFFHVIVLDTYNDDTSLVLLIIISGLLPCIIALMLYHAPCFPNHALLTAIFVTFFSGMKQLDELQVIVGFVQAAKRLKTVCK